MGKLRVFLCTNIFTVPFYVRICMLWLCVHFNCLYLRILGSIVSWACVLVAWSLWHSSADNLEMSDRLALKHVYKTLRSKSSSQISSWRCFLSICLITLWIVNKSFSLHPHEHDWILASLNSLFIHPRHETWNKVFFLRHPSLVLLWCSARFMLPLMSWSLKLSQKIVLRAC